MITIDQFSYSYDKKKVLSNLSVHFEKADFCAIMGPNGSGKSTLLKAMAHLLEDKESRIILDGKSFKDYGAIELAQKVAYVPQRQEIIFDFSVYDVVMMGRNPYQSRWEFGNATDDAIVMKVLKQTHLTHLKERMLRQLSGGELQRTLIARAMAQQAPIMLLDEPLANLDIAHKFEIMDILSELNHLHNVTILIILHDFPFALQYTNKTLLLKEGILQKFGTTEQVMTPALIRQVFDLGSEYEITPQGNISKPFFTHYH
ncbi:MAG: ABC transporter ATP-binding protein [Bacteroidales bacterium]